MANEPASTYDFLARAYAVVKVTALAMVTLAGLAVSVVALDITVSRVWTDVSVPLYALTLVALPVVAAYAVVVLLLLKHALGSASFYKLRASNLERAVSHYKNLAYNDPVTGIPNTRGLERELRREQDVASRCLILLDLFNFRYINNKHNHWKGDEYLRRFAKMVSSKSRRDEFVFKKRPINHEGDPEPSADDVKAFRKYSGGDEFFILIEGTIIDGLGYLNRLQRRGPEFEEMAFEVLGDRFPFAFHAGVIAVGLDEGIESVERRSAQCLQLTKDKDSPLRIYWNDSELPEIEPGSFQEKILRQTREEFSN